MVVRAFSDFNPLRPCGRRLYLSNPIALRKLFQSTPPVWAETLAYQLIMWIIKISIHSARVGGDTSLYGTPLNLSNFNPLRPCGRRPALRVPEIKCSGHFNPLRPCGRRPQLVDIVKASRNISIHSARVGGDSIVGMPVPVALPFQSTPPVWAETIAM